ncbi:hypothetical protein ACFL6S_28995 [Candidatus Poribacteria bacterium]
MSSRGRLLLCITALILLALPVGQAISSEQAIVHPNKSIADIRIWDTSSPFVSIEGRGDWRETSARTQLQGDMVLENQYLIVVFHSGSGKIIIYSKSGQKRAEVTLRHFREEATNGIYCKILQNTGDVTDIAVYSSAESERSSAVFSFSKEQLIQIKPAGNTNGMSILSPMEFAVIPNFISDDLVLAPKDYPLETLNVPSENLLLGLLEGEDSMLVVTWPDGNQKVRLTRKDENLFGAIDFENDGKNLSLAILDAPGIWHREVLKRSYLEKNIAIEWKRPFPAKWITQLYEDGVKTTYTFRDSRKERFWRAGLGRYTYPVWFEGETAFYRLGKKIPPKEESLVYYLERKGTPDSVSTPVDILRETLDEETYERIIDAEGRQNRSSDPPGCDYDAATCAITDKLKVIFEAGEEVQKKESIKVGTEDMTYFMTIERGRAEEYKAFAHEMMALLTQMENDRPELKEYLDELKEITGEIIAIYKHERENIGDVEYMRELSEETQALAQRSAPGNLEAFMKLKGRWTSMGGAVEDVNRALHTTTRKLFQRAGYGCVTQSEAVDAAKKIRKRITKCLRRPSPYEIWPDY